MYSYIVILQQLWVTVCSCLWVLCVKKVETSNDRFVLLLCLMSALVYFAIILLFACISHKHVIHHYHYYYYYCQVASESATLRHILLPSSNIILLFVLLRFFMYDGAVGSWFRLHSVIGSSSLSSLAAQLCRVHRLTNLVRNKRMQRGYRNGRLLVCCKFLSFYYSSSCMIVWQYGTVQHNPITIHLLIIYSLFTSCGRHVYNMLQYLLDAWLFSLVQGHSGWN